MYSLVEIGILNALTAGVLALVVLIVSPWLRRPAVVHALWVLVLLKFVTPPIVEIPVGLRLQRLAAFTENYDAALPSAATQVDSQPASATPIVVHASAEIPPINSDTTLVAATASVVNDDNIASVSVVPLAQFRWLASSIPLLLGAWLVGSAAWFIIQGWRIARFAKLVSTARPAPEDMQRQTRRLAASIGVRRVPGVWILNTAISPILWSIGSRARVIFPADLLSRVDEEARATLLTHELAHYHRGDHWVRLIEFVVTGLFWWHPAVWFARRGIEVAEEHCCDAWVVAQFPDQPRRYAEALLDTIDFLSEHRPRVAPAATGLGQVPFLRERIRLIMSGVAPKSMSGTTRLAVLATAALLLPLGPQLFDGAIRRADAALELSNLTEFPDAPSSVVPAKVDNEPVASPENSTLDIAATRQSLEALEDELIDVSATERAAWAIVNSQDGRFQAVANTDGGLILNDTFRRRSFDLTAHDISSIAFVPHRDLLAAGSANSTVYLFDCASGEPVASFAGHNAAIGSVAVSLDGQYVVSGSRDGAVKLWDIDYEREVPSRVPSQPNAINCVRFSPDGRLLAIASGDWLSIDSGSVLLWDLRGGTRKQQFDAPSPVGALAFGSDQLVTAEWSGRLTTWDLRNGTVDASATISKDTVSAASFSADAQSMLLAATDDDQTLAATPIWFQQMDRDRDGQLAWNEFVGPLGIFRNLDLDADKVVTSDEVRASIQ